MLEDLCRVDIALCAVIDVEWKMKKCSINCEYVGEDSRIVKVKKTVSLSKGD